MARPRLTVRLRFALVSGGLFLVAGFAILVVNYLLVQSSIRPTVERATEVVPGILPRVPGLPAGTPPEGTALVTPSDAPVEYSPDGAVEALRRRVERATLDNLVRKSAIALGIAGVASVVLGWLIADRFLRPVRRITETARVLSEHTLDRRIGLEGPDDELKELADTFDAMLERLHQAFEAQQRFVANASHELRTPLAISRTAVDVLAGKLQPTPDQVAAAVEKVRASTARSEHLIDRLLVLARSESGLSTVEDVDLAEVADEAVEDLSARAADREVDMRLRLAPARTKGDRVLLGHLVTNLVENGIKYNRPGGWVLVSTRQDADGAHLEVSNSGDEVDPEAVPALFEPFRRAQADRTGSTSGAGLGLSIVRSIAAAHEGQVHATARPDGGLVVEAVLPAQPAASGERA